MSSESCVSPACCEKECPPMKKAKTSEGCCAEEKCASPCTPMPCSTACASECNIYPCFSMDLCSMSDMESLLMQNKDAWACVEYCDQDNKCCMHLMVPLDNHKVINALAPNQLSCYKPMTDAKMCAVCFDCNCMDAPVPIDCAGGKVVDLNGWVVCHADMKDIKIKCFVCKDCGSCTKSCE